jgi:hypothetical protein
MSTTEDTETAAPADTRIMGVVHRALRRDLDRADRALAGRDELPERQRRALAAHV